MGQHWALANLDGKTKRRVYPGKGFWQLGSTVFDMLRPRKLVTATDVQVETREAVMQRQPHWSDPECIFILPNELIDAVFARLDDWIELVFLCATCRDLWNIGARHLISFAEQRLAKCSAIGQRLIVLGDYNDEGFFPPSLHIPEPEEERSIKSRLTMPFFMARPTEYMQIHGADPAYHNEGQWITYLLEQVLPIEWRSVDQSGIVLRNLSKGEYVTGKAMVKFNKDRKPKRTSIFDADPCLGSAVLSRICWSHCSNLPADRNITDGGNMREDDIGTMAPSTAKWVDVSKEVLAEIAASLLKQPTQQWLTQIYGPLVENFSDELRWAHYQSSEITN
ncbi:hypothetical protein K525DRAFT_361083 [Schizophyllum commune Loenen D]|nr:hypothetical protein K525DRAFT_361083 [Schizophyllum commune Loenen D]